MSSGTILKVWVAMKFPGKRKNKHFFPVEDRGRISFDADFYDPGRTYIVGIDQVLVDIEAKVDHQFLKKFSLPKGQSTILTDQQAHDMSISLKEHKCITGEFPGGAVGNTLHNYSVLADESSVALGVICKEMKVGDYSYKYICNTSSKVDLSYLQPTDGPLGKAYCLISDDGERTFGIHRGCMDQLDEESISIDLIKNSSLLLISAFLLRNEDSPLFKATIKATEIARDNHIPIVMSMGTSGLVEEKKEFFIDFIKNFVNVLAMNEEESLALTKESNPFLASKIILNWTDLTMITAGKSGIYLAGFTDKKQLREAPLGEDGNIHSHFRWEYSRAMLKRNCEEPTPVFSHKSPYMGGPEIVTNTNGAGDAALAALLHDISANHYHHRVLPNSPKHETHFLTYSSISQIGKYSNRVSYEVLNQNSPRLFRALEDRLHGPTEEIVI